MKSVTSLNNIALEERKQKQGKRKCRTGTKESANRFRRSNSSGMTAGTIETITDSGATYTISSRRSNRRHMCPRCNKVYTYKKNLARHLKFECGILPQKKCPYCGYMARYKHNLDVHVKTQHPGYYNLRK